MRTGVIALLTVLLSACSSQAQSPKAVTQGEIWGAVTHPTLGETRSIGSPAAGCLAGAQSLPLNGEGYQVLRPQRGRYYGHPETISFIQSFAANANQRGIGPILVGDMSQARGGPMAYGHGSHQTGLDVDIWFRLDGRALSADELAKPQPISMVRGVKINRQTFTDSHMELLRMAASDPRVDRIFVNPPIKQAACRTSGDRSWVSKLRPWWGHDEHFHIRLSCQPGSFDCEPQRPLASGDGCDNELDSWLESSKVLPKGPDKPNTRKVNMPVSCERILNAPALEHAGYSPKP